jgi:hypothetical protein
MSAIPQSNRADQVRRRRRQQSDQRVTKSSALAGRPVAPITTRTIPTPVSSHRIAGANGGRRYQTAVSMPGIEVRLPTVSFTSKGLKSRVLSVALSLLLGAGLYLAWNSSFFRVDTPQISGNGRIAADDIRTVLGIEGQPAFMMVPGDLQNRLRLNYPELLSAQVSLGLPNVVFVEVVERIPVISWQQGGAYTWIDAAGVAFRPRGTDTNLISINARAAPPRGLASLVDPLSPVPYLSVDLVQAITELAPSVPQGSGLIFDPQYGLGWADSRGWQVYFGEDPRGMAVKLQVYQALVSALAGKGIVPTFISVQYANAPYYRMIQ